MRITAEEYEPLKTFAFGVCDALHASGGGAPREEMARIERTSPARARDGLRMMIADLLEDSRHVEGEQLAQWDAELARHGLFTLSAVRARFDRVAARLLKSGKLESETDYHHLRSIVDNLPEAERARGWALLEAFEVRHGRA